MSLKSHKVYEEFFRVWAIYKCVVEAFGVYKSEIILNGSLIFFESNVDSLCDGQEGDWEWTLSS